MMNSRAKKNAPFSINEMVEGRKGGGGGGKEGRGLNFSFDPSKIEGEIMVKYSFTLTFAPR